MKINKENIVRYAAVAVLGVALTVGGIEVYEAASKESININLQNDDVKYAVPSGYVYTTDENGNAIGIREIRVNATEVQLDDGSIIYTVPSGYVLKMAENGNMIGIMQMRVKATEIQNNDSNNFSKIRK